MELRHLDSGSSAEEPRGRADTPHHSVWLALVTLLIVGLTGGAATAQSPPASLDKTLEAAFEEGIEGHPGVRLLQRVGVDYGGYAVLERAPKTGGWAVEGRLIWRDHPIRFPLKVDRSDKGAWSIEWSPRPTYAEALIALLEAGDLPALPAESTEGWASQRRLPALPIILTEGRAITPFGPLPLPSEGGVKPPKRLIQHVNRWVDDVLGGADGPAAIDVLAAASTPWRNLSRTSFTAAAIGFFRIHLIVRQAAAPRLRAFSPLLPVGASGDSPGGPSSLVVGMYDDRQPPGFRVSIGNRLLAPTASCPEQTTLCPEKPGDFDDQLVAAIESASSDGPPSIARVLFAATGPTTIGRALPYARRLPDALGIPPGKLFIGHIGQPKDSRPGGEER